MIEATAKLLEGMPRSVRVGSYDFQIVISEEPLVEDGVEAFGETSLFTQTITLAVDDTTTRLQLVAVLIHELHHVMWDHAELNKRATEEQAVLAFEKGWVMLIRDNPKLITWMKKGLK